MSILDNALTMASAVAVTDTAIQLGDIVDLKKSGNGIVNNPSWRIMVNTAAGAASGDPTITFDLQTSDSEDFSTYATLISGGAIAKTKLTLNSVAVDLPIPKKGLLQYVRTYATPSATLNAGKYDSYIGY